MIAREIERRGIPTVCLSSALSITEAVRPPRAVFIDFPLGHTAGKPHDKALQRHIMIDALSALDGIQVPGTVRKLPYRWSDDDGWKERVMRPTPDRPREHADDRLPRTADPQFQCEADRAAAEEAVNRGGCPGCIFLAEG